MPGPESTSWSLIEGAAAGRPEDRETFARVYLPVVRSTLAARWRVGSLRGELDDAVNEVFVECLRPGGAITRVGREGGTSFRQYLWGVTRNVARGFEKRRRAGGREEVGASEELPDGDDSRLGRLFDRSYAEAMLAEALRRLVKAAAEAGAEAERRVELLRLRLDEGRPIREIARTWGVDAARLHHEYARGREEFRHALRETLKEHHGRSEAIDEEQILELVGGAD